MLIALTPVASALNVLVFIALSGSVSGSAMQAGLAAIGLWVGWQCPWLVPLIRKRQTSPSAQAGRINP
jgi:predicted membrane-bound spermidine synthase